MKRTIAAGLVLLLVVAALPVAIFAQDITYWSGIQIQNQSDQEATICITFYKQDGTVEAEFCDVIIAAGDSKTYGTLDDLVSDGFTGSAVISSDQPVVAIVNTMGNGLDYGASSGSFSEGASEVRLPLIMKGNYGYSTWFNVQNSSSTDDAVVTITYSNGAIEGPVTIKPGAAHTFVQDDNADLPDGFVGAATVTSTGGEIVATAVEVGPTTLFAYNGFVGGATLPSMPLVQQNNWDYVTGIQIMNIGTTTSTVTVSYTPSTAGSADTETKEIEPSASATFDMNGYLGGTETFVGSAAVTVNTADQPLVVVVNQLNAGANKGAAYGGFDPASATDTANLPLIMDRNYNYFTGFNIVNAGTITTTVTFQCSGTDGADYASDLGSVDLGPGAAATFVQLDEIADGYVGSCTASATGGDAKILGIVNELNSVLGGDAFLVYEGFNK